jgi:hypothetical protein
MRLLNITASLPLLHLRGAFLAALGFEVTNTLNVSAGAFALRSGRKYDAAILCHTLSNSHKLRFEAAIQNIQHKPPVIELYLVEMPVTSGLALDAAVHFQPFMNLWVESRAAALSCSSAQPNPVPSPGTRLSGGNSWAENFCLCAEPLASVAAVISCCVSDLVVSGLIGSQTGRVSRFSA